MTLTYRLIGTDMNRTQERLEEYELPGAEALLASTLALMTGYAQHACPRGRHLMAGKVLANLARLAGDDRVSPSARRLLARLAIEWESVQVGHPPLAGRADGTSLH